MSESLNPKPGPLFRGGKNISLHVITKDNILTYLRWFNDREVTKYVTTTYPTTEQDEIEWVERLSKKKDTDPAFAIFTNEGRLIGNIGLHRVNYIDGTAFTGTVIGEKDCWSKGYGTEAKMLLLDWAFNTLNLRKVNSEVVAYNGRSRRYSEKCGYKLVATLERELYREGAYHDKLILSLFKEDWLPLWEEFRKVL